MKTIKYIIIALFILSSFQTHAQIVSGAAKQIVKAGVKKVIKDEIKKAAKTSVKKSVKAEIKKSAIATAKREAKQAAKREAKEAAKNETKQIAKSQLKRTLKSQTKKTLKSQAKQAIKKQAKNEIKSQTKKTVVNEEVAMATKRTLKNDLSNNTFSTFKRPVKHFVAKEPVVFEKALSKKAQKTWSSLTNNSVEQRNILLNDIQKNPELAGAFNSNPQLLETYNNFIGSAKYRSDLTLLRYGSNNAGKTSLMYVKGPRGRRWLKGDDLILEDNVGATIIKQKGTGRLLGKLEGNRQEGYIVKIHGNSDPALLDLFPMRNTTYHFRNCTWKTDNMGRPSIIQTEISNNIKIGGRDNSYIVRVKNYKTEYDVNGNQMQRTGQKYNDIAGHMVPDSWGGPSSGINIVPQDGVMNNSGIWKSSEVQGLNLANQGNKVERTIMITYPDHLSQRPKSFQVTQTVNGKYDVVHGVEMNQVEILNSAPE